jgi:glutamate racemase
VFSVGSENLVSLIEAHDYKLIYKTLKSDLTPLNEANIDVLALGCSHFPLIKNHIQKILPRILILDSAEAVARQVKRVLEKENLLLSINNQNYRFYTTGDIEVVRYYLEKLTIKGKVERILLQ